MAHLMWARLGVMASAAAMLHSVAAAQPVVFIDDEAGWLAAVGERRAVFFETTAEAIAMADEVRTPPGNVNLGTTTLTFDPASTGLPWQFTMTSVNGPSFFFFDSYAIVGEGLGFFPFDADTNDVAFGFDGTRPDAFAFRLLSSDNDRAATESIEIVLENGQTTIVPFPVVGSFEVVFIGVVADTPIASVLFDEDGDDGDNIAFADLWFSGGACAADCNGDGALNVLDFVCFQGMWQAQDPSGDCDANGAFNVLDFVCFQGLFVAGCE